MLIYCTRHTQTGLINSKLIHQFQVEQSYWQQVLERIVAVVKFLAARGLAFRGQNENIGSRLNGNYLGVLEILSKFDPFLAEHIEKYGNRGKGNPSYLSANVCEELVAVMGEKVLLAILKEVLTAKYYSISVDSTPDVSHVDQLTFTVRYVNYRIRIRLNVSYSSFQFVVMVLRTLPMLSSSFCRTTESRCRIAEDKRTTTRRTWLDATQDYKLDSELLIPWQCLFPVQDIR